MLRLQWRHYDPSAERRCYSNRARRAHSDTACRSTIHSTSRTVHSARAARTAKFTAER